MAANDKSWTVPVTYTRHRDGVRLLELPSELDELISSGQLDRLYIKSASPNSDTTTLGAKRPPQATTPYAVLCTDTQTYQIRQVQSSNSVFVARPAKVSTGVGEVESNGSITPSENSIGISTFATCSSFIELNNLNSEAIAAAKTYTAERWLRELLPRYDESFSDFIAGNDLSISNHAATTQRQSKEELFNEIPFSRGECEDAWRSLCAFELQNTALAPPAELLLRAWKEIFLNFDANRPLNYQDLQRATKEAHGIPMELIESILHQVKSHSQQDIDTVELEKTASATWVGEVYFATMLYRAGALAKDSSALSLDCWRALIPESWREMVSVELLGALRHERFRPLPATFESDEQSQETNLLKLVNIGSDSSGSQRTAANPGLNAAARTASKAGRNRNWHEKFKKARDAK